MAELTELLDAIEKSMPFGIGLESFYGQVRSKPQNYSLYKIKERNEIKTMGKDNIPANGTIMAYVSNDFYEIQDDKFKKLFPELKSNVPCAIVEQVKSVCSCKENQVEVIIERYLIKEK